MRTLSRLVPDFSMLFARRLIGPGLVAIAASLGLLVGGAATAAAQGDAGISGDQLLFFYDARSGRVPFFSVANPSPTEGVDIEIAIYGESLGERLGTETARVPALGNLVVDLTAAAGGAATGNAGLAVVTPIMSRTNARPVVPPEPLVGTFTLANVPLESGFGENPIGRRARNAGGSFASAGDAVDGADVSYERMTPSFLMVPVYFNPQQLGAPEDDGNRVVLMGFADAYGDRFDLMPRSHEATVSMFGGDGTLVADGSLPVNGVTRTDLQTLAGSASLDGSGKVVFEVEAGDGSVVGLFSQSLGPFGAGQRMPSVFGAPAGAGAVDDAGVAGDQLLFFYDARDGRVPFFSIANPSAEESVVVEITVYGPGLGQRLEREVSTLAPLANLVVDLTAVGAGGAVGRLGLAVVTPVVGTNDSRPVVPLEPLVGAFTLANVPLESGFGENPVGRYAVTGAGARASVGDVVEGDDVLYQRLTPDVLMIPVFFNPQQLGPPENDGNRIVLVGFEDRYGPEFSLGASSPNTEATIFDADGDLLAATSVDVDGVTTTDLQSLASEQTLQSSGKVFFDVDAGAGNVFGLFSQSLGPFGAGQRMPAVDVDTSRFPMVTPMPQPTQTPGTVGTPAPTATAPQGPGATPTPAPTAAPTPAPTDGPTPAPTPSGAPATPSPAPTSAPTPGPTGAPTPSPTPEPTPDPGPTNSPAPTPTPGPGPTPSPSPSPDPTPDPTPSPTPDPTPTPTPDPTPTPTPTAAQSTYSDVESILVGNCGGCHINLSQGGFNFAGGQSDLVNGTSNQNGGPYVSPGSPAGSYLWHKINGTQGTVGGSGNAMPPPNGGLSGPDIAAIETWILDGALP